MQQKRKTLMETRIRWNVWLCQNRDAKHQNYAAEAFIVCVMWHFRASCHHCGVLHQFFSTSWSWITHASCIFSEEKKKRKETAGTCWAPGSPVHQPGPPDNSRWAAASHLCVIIVSVFFFNARILSAQLPESTTLATTNLSRQLCFHPIPFMAMKTAWDITWSHLKIS